MYPRIFNSLTDICPLTKLVQLTKTKSRGLWFLCSCSGSYLLSSHHIAIFNSRYSCKVIPSFSAFFSYSSNIFFSVISLTNDILNTLSGSFIFLLLFAFHCTFCPIQKRKKQLNKATSQPLRKNKMVIKCDIMRKCS